MGKGSHDLTNRSLTVDSRRLIITLCERPARISASRVPSDRGKLVEIERNESVFQIQLARLPANGQAES
jgi:hypothetical protein